MSKEKAESTIIIKKIKKGHHGHHGGAWKVAYADFVTAMMAFFLLMWLLSSAPQDVLKGIADYFTPTVGLKDQKGIGFDGGRTPLAKDSEKGDFSNHAIVFGAPTKGLIQQAPEDTHENEADIKNFTSMEQALKSAMQEDQTLKNFSDQILIDQTPEGLRIQLLDSEKRPMFKPGTIEPEDYTIEILGKIAQTIKFMPNFISIGGHTINAAENNVNNFDAWQLSSERSNVVRKILESKDIDPKQIGRICGMADHDLINEENPKAVENIRISLILLKNSLFLYQNRNSAAPEKF